MTINDSMTTAHHAMGQPMIGFADYGVFAGLFVSAMACNFFLHIWRFTRNGQTHNLTHALHHGVMGITMGVLTGWIVFWAIWAVIALEIALAVHIWISTYRLTHRLSSA